MNNSIVVLDTNVWLDWLVFQDESMHPIEKAQKLRQISIVIDSPCQKEFEKVLTYPRLGLGQQQIQEYIKKIKHYSCLVDNPDYGTLKFLPKCSDRDDQKFLDLTINIGATWLLTRDKALLKLKNPLKNLGVTVSTPSQWGPHPSLFVPN